MPISANFWKDEYIWKHWKSELFWFWKLLFWFLNHFYSQKSRNLGDSQMLNFHFKILKIKNVLIAWPYLCLKRPFYGVFSGIFANQIGPKTAEKAKCQFPWPLFWPCKLVLSNTSAIYEQLYTTAQKAFSHSLVSFRPNCSKKSQNCSLLHKPPSSGTENLKSTVE